MYTQENSSIAPTASVAVITAAARMTMLGVVLLAAVCLASTAHPQTYSAEDLARRAVERRAVEAAIWGMPAVNYDLMLQEMLSKTSGKPNQMIYWGKPLDWKNQTLTPNPDSIYFMAFYDMKDVGPIVLEIPPAEGGSINGNIVNVWQMPLEDAGPSGPDAGKGGKYLILPPGRSAQAPAGYIPVISDTYAGYALLRSNLASHSEADAEKSVAYGKRMKIYPLSQAANPPPTVFSDAKDVLFDSTIRYDASFYEHLNRVVQSEPWLDRDRAMIDVLKSVGIEKGKPFQPDAKTNEILAAAVEEARQTLVAKYDAGFPPFWDGSRWMFPASPALIEATQAGYAEPDAYPVDARGLTYTYAYIGIKRMGAGQFYLITIKDKDGQPFDGAQAYRLTVPPDVPVEQYWSVTAYDRETHALIKNMPRASRSSQIAELQKNADGSVDIFFSPAPPFGKEANWVPTDPKRQFELMFRLYEPTQALADKTWRLPDVEKIPTEGRASGEQQ